MTARKKLVEVGLPLGAMNAKRPAKSPFRHEHPSTMQLWCPRLRVLLESTQSR